MKLVKLSGAAAVHTDHALFLRTFAEHALATPGSPVPHTILLKLVGTDAPLPVARYADEAAAEAALTEAATAVIDAGGRMVRLPRGLAARPDEIAWISVTRDSEGARNYALSARLDSEDRPLVFFSDPDREAVLEVARECEGVLNEQAKDFALVGGGLLVRRNRVRRIELRGSRGPDGPIVDVLLKTNIDERRLVVGRADSEAAAVGIAQEARAAITAGDDDDEALRDLGGGWAARADGIKALRVKQQKVGPRSNQQTLYATILISDDEEEVILDYAPSLDGAGAALQGFADRFEKSEVPEEVPVVDWGDEWGEDDFAL